MNRINADNNSKTYSNAAMGIRSNIDRSLLPGFETSAGIPFIPVSNAFSSPRIADLRPASLHIPDIACYDYQSVRRGSGRYERIHYRQFLACPFRNPLEPPPAKRRLQIDIENAPGKPLDKIKPDPGLQFVLFCTVRELADPLLQLTQVQDTKKERLLVLLVQPMHHSRIRLFLHQLGDQAGVQQILHSSTSRERSALRLRSSSISCRGDCRKNCDNPVRGKVSLRYSSKETTTAEGLPRRVMVCGPSCRARSTTWLKRFLAS